jgi:hypothetical protein
MALVSGGISFIFFYLQRLIGAEIQMMCNFDRTPQQLKDKWRHLLHVNEAGTLARVTQYPDHYV